MLVKKQAASNNGQPDKGKASENFDEVRLQWLLDNMCNIAKYEASQTPKLSQKVSFFLCCVTYPVRKEWRAIVIVETEYVKNKEEHEKKTFKWRIDKKTIFF